MRSLAGGGTLAFAGARSSRARRLKMTRPGFRKGRAGGGRTPAADSDGFLSSSLFSQAQILHLMKNEFARARRHGIPLGVVLMQVDRLPQLVDLHGLGLRAAVKQAVARVDELHHGYAVDLDGTISGDQLEEMTGYEALCCSFLRFDVRPLEHGHRVTIEGPKGTKSFLAQEFLGSS